VNPPALQACAVRLLRTTVRGSPRRSCSPLDRLEEGLEVALAEAERAVPLDDLEEHRRAVAEGLGEDLQQVAVLVPVDEDAGDFLSSSIGTRT
jgi:hypothetical protein